jgi:hypothetical protein
MSTVRKGQVLFFLLSRTAHGIPEFHIRSPTGAAKSFLWVKKINKTNLTVALGMGVFLLLYGLSGAILLFRYLRNSI